MTVLKFGGSCLTSQSSLNKVLEFVKNYPNPIIVVSALSGVTDSLIDAANSGGDIDGIIARHYIKLPEGIEVNYYRELNEKVNVLKALLTIYSTNRNSKFLESHIQSFGERFSALMLKYFLESNGIKSKNLESEELGIKTFKGFNNAIIDSQSSIEPLKKVIGDTINEGSVPIITGYYGVDEQGHITLLGRNGSDYTAAFVARALGEKEVVLFKDVPGFFTADPKKVKNPDFVSYVSFDQAYELSSYGAKIVHPYAVLEARKGGARIVIKDFNDGKTGTIISETNGDKIFVTSKRKLSILRIIVPDASNISGILFNILNKFSENGINIIQNFTSFSVLNIIISRDNLMDAERVLSTFSRVIEYKVLHQNACIISVVGNFSIQTQNRIHLMILELSKKYPDKIYFSNISSPGISIYLAADEDIEEDLVRTIHEMVGNGL